jgi:serine/threonine-protein kinase
MSMKCGACGTEQLSDKSRFCHQCGAPLVVTGAADPMVGKVVGNYQVLAVIGEGGMGKVYRAEQVKLRRPVCLKTLLPQFAKDDSLLQRFEREGVATASMRHPNIVSVFDFGRTDDGTLYIVMELIEGKTMRAVLKEEAPLPVGRALGLMSQVLAALDEAHANNVVHRDLKPSNILVSKLRDGADLVKVVDFGIAKILGGDVQGPGLTRTGMMVGTMGYMAPEQLLGQQIDGRADLYSAGVILWELLTGRKLFAAKSEQEAGEAHLLQAAASPSTIARQPIPASVDSAVLKALEKAANRRFKSAQEFRAQLDAARLAIDVRQVTGQGTGNTPSRPSAPVQVVPAPPAPAPAPGLDASGLAGMVPEKLLTWATALPALASQRTKRPLAVAAVEIVGLSGLSTGRSPAEVSALVASLATGLVSAATAAGGHAERLPGNSLVALFGLREVREDDAARALFATTAMRQAAVELSGRVGVEVGLSIGVHVDQVVSGGYEHPLDDPAISELLARARRIAAQAHGAVLASADVQRAAGSRLRFKAHPTAVEGGQPLVEFLGELESSASLDVLAGRVSEVEAVRALTGVIAQRGAGGLMLVAGGGMGKTRLLDEVARLAREKNITVARARGGRFATTGPYEVARELVHTLTSRPGAEGAERSTLVGLSRLGVSTVDISRLERIFGITGAPAGDALGDEQQLVDRALIISVVQRAARAGPLLVLLDDAHLADRPSLEVLERLIGAAGATPLGLVVAARPQGLEGLLPKVRRVELKPLARAELEQLVISRLPAGKLAPELLEFVLDRSQGNPLFAREIVAALAEQGGMERRDETWGLSAKARLPESVAQVISARLERLTPNARALLSWGAVVGRTFDANLVANAVDTPLDLAVAADECVQRELLLPAERAAGSYTFRQQLVHERVLALLPGPERRHMHQRVAESLERGLSSGAENVLEAMARHFHAADRPRKAFKYLRGAADQHLERGFAPAAALAYQQCLQLLQLELPKDGPAPEAAVTTWLEVGARAVEALSSARPKAAVELAERVLAVGTKAQAPAARAEALRQKGLALGLTSRPTEAEAALLEARALGEGLAQPGFLVGLNADLASALEAKGELAKAAELLVGGLQELGTKRGAKQAHQLWQYLNQLGRIHLRLGKVEQAREYFESARTRARAADSDAGEARAMVNLAVLAAQQRDAARALALLDEALELVEKTGDAVGRVRIRHNRGLVLRSRGEAAQAKASFEAAASEARELGWREGEALASQALAQVATPAGKPSG